MPYAEAAPQVVLDSLLEARWKADRVENLHVQALQIRAQVARMANSLRAQADDAWTTALVKARSARRAEFEGPRERYADADLASLTEKRDARKADDLLSLADEVSDVIRVSFRGLNEVIQDHRTWLRALQFQTYLEK
jgi:hypothetical protein